MDDLQQVNEERGAPTSNQPTENNSIDYEAEYVALPSKGIYNKGKYKGLEKVLVKKLSWEEEDILTTKSYYDNNTLFDEILKSCIVDPNGVTPDDLISIDRDTIIWWLRIGAFGTQYEVSYTCSDTKCKNKFRAIWNLSDFELPELPETYLEEINETNGIVIELPDSKLKCKITVPTAGLEKKVLNFLKKRKENLKKKKTISSKVNTTKDFNVTGKLLTGIEAAYDSNDKEYKGVDQLLIWLNSGNDGKKLSMLDSRYIISKLKEINLIADTKIELTCPMCEHTEEGVRMPMSIYFFWPEFDEL
jgi:hypothetical protein